jgi:hypothetical protein
VEVVHRKGAAPPLSGALIPGTVVAVLLFHANRLLGSAKVMVGWWHCAISWKRTLNGLRSLGVEPNVKMPAALRSAASFRANFSSSRITGIKTGEEWDAAVRDAINSSERGAAGDPGAGNVEGRQRERWRSPEFAAECPRRPAR